MQDSSRLRSRAQASLRLAELAKTPRARELFRELADEYERRAQGDLTAGAIEDAAPPLAPLVADAPPIADVPASPGTSVAAEAPLVPASDSDHFLADLKALRRATLPE